MASISESNLEDSEETYASVINAISAIPESEIKVIEDISAWGDASTTLTIIGSGLMVASGVVMYYNAGVVNPLVLGLFGTGGVIVIAVLSTYAYNSSREYTITTITTESVTGKFSDLTGRNVKLHIAAGQFLDWNNTYGVVNASNAQTQTYDVIANGRLYLPTTMIGKKLVTGLSRFNLELIDLGVEADNAQADVARARAQSEKAANAVASLTEKLAAAKLDLTNKTAAAIVGQRVTVTGLMGDYAKYNNKSMTVKAEAADGTFELYYKWSVSRLSRSLGEQPISGVARVNFTVDAVEAAKAVVADLESKLIAATEDAKAKSNLIAPLEAQRDMRRKAVEEEAAQFPAAPVSPVA